ncbi:MAG: lactate utilization protein [Thermodesulfobacteriota bacterium]
MCSDDRIALLMERAKLVQAEVSRIPGLDAAFDYVIERMRERNYTTLAAPNVDPTDALHLADRCRSAGIEWIASPLRNRLRDIQAAFSMADGAIAETGTLIQVSDDEDVRIATMLSELHIACITSTQIYPDVFSIADRLRDRLATGPGYLSWITGPSRTADIERVLAIGVHGPLELHILILEEARS